MQRKPMSLKELYTIDKKLIKRASKIQETFQEVFDIRHPENTYIGLHSVFHQPLLIEAELYYNGELLSTYAMFKALREYGYDYRLTAFHFESLLTRIVSFWEYIYQFINHYLDLNLYDFKSKQAIIELHQHSPEFTKEGEGTRVDWIKKPESECKKIRKELGKNIRSINMRNIVNYTAGIYEVKDEWDSLLKVIVNNNIDYIKDIRNQIIHQRPAGAKFTVDFDLMFKGYNVSVKPDGWIDFDDVEPEIDLCIERIRDSVRLIKGIVNKDYIPNRLENAGKEYYLEEVKCRSCNEVFLVADIILGEEKKFQDVVFCYKCGEMGVDALDNRIQTTEVNFGTLFSNYFDRIRDFNKDETK